MLLSRIKVSIIFNSDIVHSLERRANLACLVSLHDDSLSSRRPRSPSLSGAGSPIGAALQVQAAVAESNCQRGQQWIKEKPMRPIQPNPVPVKMQNSCAFPAISCIWPKEVAFRLTGASQVYTNIHRLLQNSNLSIQALTVVNLHLTVSHRGSLAAETLWSPFSQPYHCCRRLRSLLQRHGQHSHTQLQGTVMSWMEMLFHLSKVAVTDLMPWNDFKKERVTMPEGHPANSIGDDIPCYSNSRVATSWCQLTLSSVYSSL